MCFADMLGFGSNVVTAVAIVTLVYAKRNTRRMEDCRMHLSEKACLLAVPAFGACASLFDILLLFSNVQRHIHIYHVWLFSCSKLASWMTLIVILLMSKWRLIFCNKVFCLWWMLKVLLDASHGYITFPYVGVPYYFTEGVSVFSELIFGIFLFQKLMSEPVDDRTLDDLEEAFLPREIKSQESCMRYVGQCIHGYWKILTFREANYMMDLGVTKQLDFPDLIHLPPDLMPPSCYSTLVRCWVAEESKSCRSRSLFKAICHAYGWSYLRLGLLKVVNDAIGFMGPLLLNKLIVFLQRGSGHFDGYVLALSLGFASILKSFLDTQYTFNLQKMKLKLRSGIMSIVYDKCLHVSLAERSMFSHGEIQTFMSIDADRTVNLCNSFHDMWSLPLQIGVALYLLYTQVRFAFLSGLAITLLLIPVNKWISTMIASATLKMMMQKDERIRSVGELLTSIRTLKMYSWEHIFANRIMQKRKSEVKHLATRKYLDAWCVFFWATTPALFSLFTFGLFTLMGHSLDAATVFTCVALFNILISPLNSFPWVINGLIDAIISTRRLSKFLSCGERKSDLGKLGERCKSDLGFADFDEADDTNSQMAIVFQDADFAWSNGEDERPDIVIKQISLNFPKGCFIAVVGEVGSGKSSLLNAILREMRLVSGSVISHGSTAYVPQIPWIMSGSLRNNVLFGKAYNARRYLEVVQACALDVDISSMDNGDLSYIGEKGVNLSGGQKTRLALARAAYHGSDIFLLDDVLSAVDAHVACWILHKVILGPLMQQRTRVMCTHNFQAITASDMVVIMDKGCIKWTGRTSNFLSSPYSTTFLKDANVIERGSFLIASMELMPSTSDGGDSENASEELHEIASIEVRKEGRVEFGVYKGYAAFCRWPMVAIICISAGLMQASRNGNDLWLSYWVDSQIGSERLTKVYLGILSIFCAVNSFLTLARAFSFAYGGLHAAVNVHSKLLNKLINAPVHFFDQNPSGRILNRFSSDLYTIDDSLPFILNILLANFFNIIGIVIVLSYAQVMFLLLVVPFWFLYNKLQFYYRATSREVRRLDSVARSPIYATFTETLDGSSTIRAFKMEDMLMEEFTDHVMLYQRTSFSELVAGLWLSLRLQLLAAVIISYIAVMAVIGSRGDFPISLGTPGLVGLALSYAAPIVSLLSSFLTSFAETEKEMVSVERVLQYIDIPQEELHGSRHPDQAWPTAGHIVFDCVALRYMPSLPPALHDVSFHIPAGTHVGVIGRTGAGKSSIVNALFRLTPICSGKIFVDGVNIADLVVRDLRSRLSVVPQSPFLFEGSLRDNLDPSGQTSDAKIWEALRKCCISDAIEAAGGLDIQVKEAGISFSVGQRQLICLARALIKSSKVLCLDECTANVDAQTTTILHDTIRDECKGMTVITIAHRVSVVLNMDNILILDHGSLVEQGNPRDLLNDESSRFSSYVRASSI